MSECTAGEYTAPNGLIFSKTCNSGADALSIEVSIANNLEECMDTCSAHVNDLCLGVTYELEGSSCILQGPGENGSLAFNTTSTNASHMARVNTDQLRPLNPVCPFEDGSIQSHANGMEFRIFCDQWYDGDMTRFADLPGNQLHTETMEECIEACANGVPLCTAVTWNPTLQDGYPNCHPAQDINEGNLKPDAGVSHVAIVSNWSPDDDCTDDSTFVSEQNSTFRITCGTNASGPDLDVVKAEDIEDCVQQCASFKPNSTADPCEAVIYEPLALNSGYRNCFLRSSVEDERNSDNYIMAVLDNSEPPPTTNVTEPEETPLPSPLPSPSASSLELSPGAIAGLVIGLVALVSLILGAWWWYCRRQRARPKHVESAGRTSRGLIHEAPVAPVEMPGSLEKDSSTQELESPQRRVPELAGDTTKRHGHSGAA